MNFFSRTSVIAVLTAILVLAGLFGGPDNMIDWATIARLGEIRDSASPQLTALAIIITDGGSLYATMGLGLSASLWLLVRGNRGRAALLAGLVIIERLVMDGLKLAIGRPRPWFDDQLVVTYSMSYPSGHAANTMAVFVAVALFAVPPAHRRPALIAAILASVLVGISRPYLGVHWPSDIIGGWALGLIMVGLAILIGRRAGVIEPEAQHDVVGGQRPPAGKDEAA